MEFSRSSYLSLPDVPGVYLFEDNSNRVLYVGKAKDLKSRVSSYFTSSNLLGEKTRLLVNEVSTIKIVKVENELEALLLEAYYIKKYRPHYNIRLTDDKSYPLIKITPKAEYPAVLYARRMDDPKAVYFGPYPSPQDVRRVLRVVRRAFPFQSAPRHAKKKCLYYHLGLCPCIPAFDTPENRDEYKKNIQKIIKVLEGKSKIVQKELEKEREQEVKNENFEKASILTQKLQTLSLITAPHHKPLEYDTNPNLRTDLRKNELAILKTVLFENGFNIKSLGRIECYDISNFQGINATGSMVVLTNGEIDKSQYRRFKIKITGKPNDAGMIEEMLTRRIKHLGWDLPDLMIVDGGKSQLTGAMRAFSSTKTAFPLIGLAKRLETIVIPLSGKEDNFKEVNISHHSPAIHLLQRVRDEAHRFAVSYHKKLRSRSTFSETN